MRGRPALPALTGGAAVRQERTAPVPDRRIYMSPLNTCTRVAGVLTLAATTSIVVAIHAPAAQAAAVDPTKVSAAASAAEAAKAALVQATASKAKAEQAVSEAATALDAAQDALSSARDHLTMLDDRVKEATVERLTVESDGGLLDVAAAATGESDSTLVDAAGTAVTAGLGGVVGPIIGALNPLDDALDEQVEDADRDLAAAERREQAVRADRAEAVRAQRAVAVKVSEAEGLQDAADAALVATEDDEKVAGAASAAADAAAESFAASLGIDKRLVLPGIGAISSPYGMRTHPITGAHKLHTGTDFQVADGRAYAAAAGTVAAVTRDAAYGNIVTIAHGKGVTTRYAHLARSLVKPGDTVVAAQVVGRIGSTGLSTGPHLHFEVQVDGQFQNPATWLAR